MYICILMLRISFKISLHYLHLHAGAIKTHVGIKGAHKLAPFVLHGINPFSPGVTVYMYV